MSDSPNNAVVGFQQKGVAETFCRILQQHQMPATLVIEELETGQPHFVVVVSQSEHLLKAQMLAREFIHNPQAPKFQQAAWDTGEVYDSIPSLGFPTSFGSMIAAPFTSIVIIACVAVYIGFFLGFYRQLEAALMIQPLSQLLDNHQWWRLLGPNFLHFGLLHITFNLLWWWVLGSKLERTFGSFWLVVLFVVSTLFANISQLLATGPNFGGLSGVVYALFGFVWWIGWLRPSWGLGLPKMLIGFMLVWLLLGFANILPINMANYAHAFGLGSGCLMALLLHFGANALRRN